MTGEAPHLALSLLRRWTPAPRRESLIGDLIEQHAHGRSRLWFWRQTVQAVLSHVVDDARCHVTLVARASVMAVALILALEWIPLWLYQQAGAWLWNWSVANDYDTFRLFWFGRPHWPEPPRMLANCFVALLVGVIVARTHRTHAATAVLAATVAWPAFAALPKLGLDGPTLGEFWKSSPAWFLVALVWTPLCVLVGGILGTADVQESHANAEVSLS